MAPDCRKIVAMSDGRLSPNVIEQQVWHQLVNRLPTLANPRSATSGLPDNVFLC